SVVLSQISVAGISTPVNDNFLADNGQLDTNTWTIVANNTNTVQLLADPGALFLEWSLPDTGFGLQTTTDLFDTNSWVTLTGPDATNSPPLSFFSAGARLVYLPSSILGGAQARYFRLLQQVFTRLQILLPGETAAPGTPSGKTGAPTNQQVGVAFDVTV